MSLGITALRAAVGPLFVGHGTQKLFGWFGGHGLEGTAGFFENVGLRPGRRNAIAAGLAEAVGGALLTLGALTPIATTMIAGSMVTAMRKVHLEKGPWVTEQGYEYNLVLVCAMVMLAEHGPGSLSVDQALFPDMKGKGWAAASMAAAVGGSLLVDRLSEPAPQQAQAASAGDPASTTDPARFTREMEPAPEA